MPIPQRLHRDPVSGRVGQAGHRPSTAWPAALLALLLLLLAIAGEGTGFLAEGADGGVARLLLGGLALALLAWLALPGQRGRGAR